MDPLLKKEETLLVFLTENMKEMELELRAQSIVLEALAEKVVGVDDLSDALVWARSSEAMREFVRTKYLPLEELCGLTGRVRSADAFVGWIGSQGATEFPN